MRHTALVLALITASTLPAQQVVRPGLPTLHPDRVRVRVDTIALLVTPKDSVEQRQATLIRSVVRLRAAAGDIFRETQEYDFASGPPGIDTLDVDARTLAPVRDMFAQGPSSHDVRIHGTHVTGTRTSPDSGVRAVDYSAPEPFVVSMMNEAFTAAYPIADSTTLDVVVADPPSARVSHSRWEILGHQTLITARGPVDCLIATVSGRAQTMWFDQRDGSLLWLRWMIPGGTEVWKLPARDVEFRDRNAIAPLKAP
jgi:hypothetical protein